MGNQKVTPEYIQKLSTATEEELREMQAPWPDTLEELNEVISVMAARDHTYGTCVYAMSFSAVAAFNYICHAQGTTGFQASCADMDILRRTRCIDGPFSFRTFRDMLYPQSGEKFACTITKHVWEWLQEKAKELIAEDDKAGKNGRMLAHSEVRAHWERIVSGTVPFGYIVDKED